MSSKEMNISCVDYRVGKGERDAVVIQNGTFFWGKEKKKDDKDKDKDKDKEADKKEENQAVDSKPQDRLI